jgi:hypothetical protein
MVVGMLLGKGIFAGQGAEAQRSNPVSEPYSARSWPAMRESEASSNKLRASISVRASELRAVSRCIGLEYNVMVSLTVWLIGK